MGELCHVGKGDRFVYRLLVDAVVMWFRLCRSTFLK